MKDITIEIADELKSIGFKFDSKMISLDYYIPGTDIRYSNSYDKGIFHDPETRFVEAIYRGDAFENVILYEGNFENVTALKNKLIELKLI